MDRVGNLLQVYFWFTVGASPLVFNGSGIVLSPGPV